MAHLAHPHGLRMGHARRHVLAGSKVRPGTALFKGHRTCVLSIISERFDFIFRQHVVPQFACVFLT